MGDDEVNHHGKIKNTSFGGEDFIFRIQDLVNDFQGTLEFDTKESEEFFLKLSKYCPCFGENFKNCWETVKYFHRISQPFIIDKTIKEQVQRPFLQDENLKQIFSNFLQKRAPNLKRIPNFETKKNLLENFLDFCKENNKNASPEVVSEFLTTKPNLKNTTIENYTKILIQFISPNFKNPLKRSRKRYATKHEKESKKIMSKESFEKVYEILLERKNIKGAAMLLMQGRVKIEELFMLRRRNLTEMIDRPKNETTFWLRYIPLNSNDEISKEISYDLFEMYSHLKPEKYLLRVRTEARIREIYRNCIKQAKKSASNIFDSTTITWCMQGRKDVRFGVDSMSPRKHTRK